MLVISSLRWPLAWRSGTRFYLLATIATVMICFILWGMSTLNLFAKDVREQILKIRIPADMRYDQLFTPVFDKYLVRFSLIAVESVQAGTQTELIYGVELRNPNEVQDLMKTLRQLNDNNKIALITGYHEIDL